MMMMGKGAAVVFIRIYLLLYNYHGLCTSAHRHHTRHNRSDVFAHFPGCERNNNTAFGRLARRFNKTVQMMQNMIEMDESLQVDWTWINDSTKEPAIFYAEKRPPPPLSTQNGQVAASLPAHSRRFLPAWDYNVDVFKLHSNPNATKIIYLDFDGHNITNSKWNEGRAPVIVAPPCNWEVTAFLWLVWFGHVN